MFSRGDGRNPGDLEPQDYLSSSEEEDEVEDEFVYLAQIMSFHTPSHNKYSLKPEPHNWNGMDPANDETIEYLGIVTLDVNGRSGVLKLWTREQPEKPHPIHQYMTSGHVYRLIRNFQGNFAPGSTYLEIIGDRLSYLKELHPKYNGLIPIDKSVFKSYFEQMTGFLSYSTVDEKAAQAAEEGLDISFEMPGGTKNRHTSTKTKRKCKKRTRKCKKGGRKYKKGARKCFSKRATKRR